MILDAKLKSRNYMMIVTSGKRAMKNIVTVKTFHEDIFRALYKIQEFSIQPLTVFEVDGWDR